MRQIKFLYKNELKSGYLAGVNNVVFESSDDVENFQKDNYANSNNFYEIANIRIFTPTNPSKIVCVGRNYAEHAAELGNEIPKEPLLFLKAPSSIIPENEEILIPVQSVQVEHEGELGIIIGKDCKNIQDSDDVTDFILGYICLNDVTARDLQKKDIQFTRAKSFDTFCPVSDFITTGIDVSDLKITTKVNGIIKQNGRTSQMVFPVEFLVRYISNQMTLNFGDIIATGTPSGVSQLVSGDLCEVEIENVGKISNRVSNFIEQ